MRFSNWKAHAFGLFCVLMFFAYLVLINVLPVVAMLIIGIPALLFAVVCIYIAAYSMWTEKRW